MFMIREFATLLAALQYWSEEMSPHGRAIMRPYFRSVGCESVMPLNRAELARLSARLQAQLKTLDG